VTIRETYYQIIIFGFKNNSVGIFSVNNGIFLEKSDKNFPLIAVLSQKNDTL
jgi:hypothetical protein